jgi:hypothetical protein
VHRVLVTALFALLVLAANVQPQQRPPESSAVGIKEVLWWLPPDTETILVTQVPVRPMNGPLVDEMANLSAQVNLGDATYAKTMMRHLQSAPLKATLEGSRHFTPPSGLGDMRYEGATMYLFAKPLDANGNALMTELKKTALSVDRIQGFTVLEFRDKIEDDIWSSYIAVPRPDILLQATNREYLKELLGRVVTHPGERALPDVLPEWRWVDTNSPFWAVRHYRHDHSKDDPTSPFRKSPSGIALDIDALGLTAHASSDGRTVVVYFLSRAAAPEKVADRIFTHTGDGVRPAFRKAGDGAIEVRFTATDGEHLSMFLFYLFAALGHATYL